MCKTDRATWLWEARCFRNQPGKLLQPDLRVQELDNYYQQNDEWGLNPPFNLQGR
jgi:hypothetical protein